MDENRVHTSIVIELANQEEPEYQKAYQIDFGDLDMPRDYVIDQIFCGENVTVYAVFEISDDRKSEKQLEEPNYDVHGDYRIYREKSSRKLLSSDKFCKFIPKARSKDDMKPPFAKSCGMLYRIPVEKENYWEEEKEYDSKNLFGPEKITLGTNTSMAKFTPLFYDKNAVQDTSEFKTVKIEGESETTRKAEGLKSQTKEKSKKTILKEIKKLQKKINSLIRTIESSDLDFEADDFEISGADSLSLDETQKDLDMDNLESFMLSELEPTEKNHKNTNDLSFFSQLPYARQKQKNTHSVRELERHESTPIALTRSVSLLSFGSSTTQIIISGDKSDATLRRASSECRLSLLDVENWRGPGLSKSEVLKHAVLLNSKYNLMKGVRKSLSLELRDDKLEVICLKKIKNFPFKVDGSVKSKGNTRTLPKREPSMRDSLPMLSCEMGDEANKKAKTSKADLLGLVQVCEKQNALSFEKINLTPNKNLNEEEGDAKLLYPKKNSPAPRFTRNNTELEVHFCSATNSTASDGVLKIDQNPHMNKLKLKSAELNTDPGPKTCSDSEKPTTPVRNYRKTTTISDIKKEVKPIKKSIKKKSRSKFEKTDGKDVSLQEPLRPKSVISNRKHFTKGYPESKILMGRPAKPDSPSKIRSSYLAKYSPEEKSGNKSDRLPRLISQRKEVVEPPNDCVEIKEKELKTPRKNYVTVSSSQKKIATGLTNGKPESSPVECEQEKTSGKIKDQTSVQESSSVVVELFSEKPQPEDIVLNEVQEVRSRSRQNPELGSEPAIEENNTQELSSEGSKEFKKPVVKSLWALTKLILFEDGTQKLEILEASSNPPSGFN